MGFLDAAAQCVLDFLVDDRCHACGATHGSLCPEDPPAPLAVPAETVALPGLHLHSRPLCVSCAMRISRWPDSVILQTPPGGPLVLHPAFVTDERLLVLVHLLKFSHRERLAPWLARAALSVVTARGFDGGGATMVVPVPMDRESRARRGFNQAESIARTMAASLGLPLQTGALAKLRRTRPQSALGRESRLTNVRGAFCAESEHVRGARVLLVDDLVTTGATVRACADALRAAGAAEVAVLCVGYRDETSAPKDPFLQS